MNNLSTWSKTNLLLSFIILLFTFLTPLLIEKFSYAGKVKEAESVCANIASQEKELYGNKNRFQAISKSRQTLLSSTLQVRAIDLKYYTYTINTTNRSFTIVAEPKIQFLKERTVPPKTYTYRHTLDGIDIKKWSTL